MKILFIFFTLFSFTFAATELKIYIFSVGGADSQLVLFPSGYSILIDAGEPAGSEGTVGEEGVNGKYLANRLYSILGKKKIDVFVLSHFHFDHSGGYGQGGIWYLIEKAGFTFTKFYHRSVGTFKGSSLSSCSRDSISWNIIGSRDSYVDKFVCYATATTAQTKLSKIGTIAQRCNKKQIVPPDEGAEIDFLIRDAYGAVDTDTGKKLNRNSMKDEHPVNENTFSMCMRIVYGKFVYATCGDLPGRQTAITETTTSRYHDMETLIAPMMGEVDLYKVNHHGTKWATNQVWANTLKPTVSVVSCGDGSTTHPSSSAMKYLTNVKSQVYTTGLCYDGGGSSYYKTLIRMGDDVIVTVPKDGTTFTVEGSKGQNKATYTIKQSKTAAVKCYGLENV